MQRFLVSTAAAVIILAGVVYLFGQWQNFRAMNKQREDINAGRLELFRRADAKEGEVDKVKSFCQAAERSNDQSEVVKVWVNNCHALSYL